MSKKLFDAEKKISQITKFQDGIRVTDWYHNDKDMKYLTKLKESLIRIMERHNLKQINVDGTYFDVFINKDKTEEMCMVFKFEFNHIEYGD